MSFIGGLLKITGTVVGKTTEVVIKGTGEVIGAIAEEFGENKIANTSRTIGKGVGEFTNEAFKTTGKAMGYIADKTIEASTEIGGNIGGGIAEGLGGNKGDVQKGKQIGSVVGGAAVGFLVGDLVGAGLTTATALTGTASTGTAISTLHGIAETNATLAQIGGGALSAGGGGVAAGQAVLNGINVVTTADGAFSSMKMNAEKSEVNGQERKSLNNLNVKTEASKRETNELIDKLRSY